MTTQATAAARRSPIQKPHVNVAELMTKPALTLKEAGLVLGVSKNLLWKLIKEGEGPPAFRIGTIWYVRTDALTFWLRKLEAAQQQAAVTVDE